MKRVFKICPAMILCLALFACASRGPMPGADAAWMEKYDEMVLIPEGEFLMGSNPEDEKRGVDVGLDELPQRRVHLKAYYIDRYEATNRQYKRFVDATGHRPPFDWKDGEIPPGEETHPVAHINWYDADAYCRWAGKRLPTEAEWEKAARGAAGRIYPWGDAFDKDKANTREWQRERIPVGSMPGGASPYGVMDMAGNVWEWTADWYNPYPGNEDLEREAFGRTHKVTRGGAWNSYHNLARANWRFARPPEEWYQCFVGVRCVKNE